LVHPILLTNRILWGSILFSSLLFPVVLVLIEQDKPQLREPIVMPVLGVLAVTAAIMSRVLPTFMRRQAFAREQIRIEQQTDPHSAMALYRGAAPTRRVFADREGARMIAMRVQQTTSILGLALSEAVGLFGFALGYIGFEVWQAAPFFVVGWILILTLFPTERAAIRALERHYDATLA
jgi:hypothetical protein